MCVSVLVSFLLKLLVLVGVCIMSYCLLWVSVLRLFGFLLCCVIMVFVGLCVMMNVGVLFRLSDCLMCCMILMKFVCLSVVLRFVGVSGMGVLVFVDEVCVLNMMLEKWL